MKIKHGKMVLTEERDLTPEDLQQTIRSMRRTSQMFLDEITRLEKSTGKRAQSENAEMEERLLLLFAKIEALEQELESRHVNK